MRIYHEISPDRLDHVLRGGIKQGLRGNKSDDKSIKKTDYFLDKHRPESLKALGISRENNVYGYLAQHGMVFSIKDGQEIPVSAFIKQSSDAVVEIIAQPDKCYVSDLDVYDTLKSALESNSDERTLRQLASVYWQHLIPLNSFDTANVRRPEVMITYDIPRTAIRVSKMVQKQS